MEDNKNNKNNIYLYKKGKKVMNEYKFMEQIGWLEEAKKIGIIFNPTHNFELLKEVRKENFEKHKNILIANRKIDDLETTDYEINCFYIMWSNNELKVIKQWLSDTYPNGSKKTVNNSNSNKIELMKYNNYVTKEIEKTEKLINPPQQQIKKKLALKDFFVNTNEKEVLVIQNTFKDSEATDLAMLIYRLKELEKIEIKPNSKTKSTKHFIEALTGVQKRDMSHINRTLQTDIKIAGIGITNPNYLAVKKKLDNILNSKVV